MKRNRTREISAAIEDYVGSHKNVFLSGACWALVMFLKRRYPDTTVGYDPIVGHLVAIIDEVCYDANGIIPKPTSLTTRIPAKACSQMRRSAKGKLIEIGHWDSV